MKILVAYNDDTALKTGLNEIERLGEAEVVESAAAVAAILSESHECRLLPVSGPLLDLAHLLREANPDLIFNFCEGVYGRTDWESNFALFLEMLDLRFTGCSSVSLALCQDKGLLKRILQAEGIPTPPGFVATTKEPWPDFLTKFETLGGLAIVKPCREDGGLGVERGSVVSTPAEALERVHLIHQKYKQPALVESFIDGREINLALYASSDDLVTLPPGEILFDPALATEQRIVGWQAKWDAGSVEDMASPSTLATLPSSERQTVEKICRAAAGIVGIDGYCRFDLRRDHQGRFFIIDVNPNPDIGPGSGFRKALEAAEVPFSEFLNQLMMTKLRGRPSSEPPLTVR